MIKQQTHNFVQYIAKRFKSKKLVKWQAKNTENAHQYFTEYYSHFYGGQWSSIREALLSEHNYAALVNNFHDGVPKTKELFESMGAIDIHATYNNVRAGRMQSNILYVENTAGSEMRTMDFHRRKLPGIDPEFVVNIVPESKFDFPENLLLFINKLGDGTALPRTTMNSKGIQSHFLFDGASILPPLMLNVQSGDRVFDACSAPGGKSLLLLQTKKPAYVVCNDLKVNRTKRIVDMFEHYLPNFHDEWNNKHCEIRQKDARSCREYDFYDKILVDVPCSTDRHAVSEGDNFIFLPANNEKLERLPTLQIEILANCIRMLKPGGSLVYSTCSLSPKQNDDVVETALWRAFSTHSITANVMDLTKVCAPFQFMFKFYMGTKLKYGQLVVPNIFANFGPMYFCKMTRN